MLISTLVTHPRSSHSLLKILLLQIQHKIIQGLYHKLIQSELKQILDTYRDLKLLKLNQVLETSRIKISVAALDKLLYLQKQLVIKLGCNISQVRWFWEMIERHIEWLQIIAIISLGLYLSLLCDKNKLSKKE